MAQNSSISKGFWALLAIVLSLVGALYGAQVYTDHAQDADLKEIRNEAADEKLKIATLQANWAAIDKQLDRIEAKVDRLDRRDRRLDSATAK